MILNEWIHVKCLETVSRTWYALCKCRLPSSYYIVSQFQVHHQWCADKNSMFLMGLGFINSTDIYWVLNTGKLNLKYVVFRGPYVLVNLWGPETMHVQGFVVLGTEWMLSNCFPWSKMATIRRKRMEREDTDCALRKRMAWCGLSGMNDTDSHIRWICTQLNVRLFSIMASQPQDTIPVLQRIWDQPAFVCGKMPELWGLKGLVSDVIIIFLHSIVKGNWKTSPLSAQTFPKLTRFLWQ